MQYGVSPLESHVKCVAKIRELEQQNIIMLKALEHICSYPGGHALRYVQELKQIARDTITKVKDGVANDQHRT